MAQESWQTRQTRVVASQIRLYRAMAGLSAQDVANRCAELGFPIPRPVLSNLETGRRDAVSVSELIIIARALEVSPLQLVMPVGRQEMIELLPGQDRPVWDAARWFSGEINQYQLEDEVRPPLPGFKGNVLPDDPLPAFRRHDELLARWHESADALTAADALDSQMLELRARRMRQLEEDLGHLRRQMRVQGLTPPPLPPDLANVDRPTRKPVRDTR